MRIILIFFFLLIIPEVYSQEKQLKYSIESTSVISIGKRPPFWLFSNQYGKISAENNSSLLQPSIFKTLTSDKKFDYSFCIEPIIKYDGSGKIYMQQWFGNVKFYFLQFSAGAKEEFFGNQDSSLSSGFILWSKNARPMTKISFEAPNYTVVPFTWKYLEFKGGISHGWFDNNEYNNNVWLHHKYGFLRLGGRLPVHISYGLHHYAQWGGELEGKKLPNKLKDFKSVFLVRSGGTDAPGSESLNKLGNHLGSKVFGLDAELKGYTFAFYWQTIFEDGSGYAGRNYKDGLFGFSIHSKGKNKLISGFVYEFLNTTDQSGRINETDSIKPNGLIYELGGNDNYFNNGIYIAGWSFRDMILGSPLITSPAIMHGNRFNYIQNNKITAHHFGLEGFIGTINYKFLYTYTFNYGTNFIPIMPAQSQHSLFLNTTISDKLPWNIKLSCSVGADFGKFYGNNFGIQVSLLKTGCF